MSLLEQIIRAPLSFLGKFGKKSGNSVIGVDIGPSSIKVVQLRREGGRAILETYGELALGPYAGLSVGQATNLSAEKIAEVLKDILREANVTTKEAAFSIPLAASLTSVISLPAVSEKELKSMVPIEARKYIPVPISETTLDFWVIPKRENDTLEIERESLAENSGEASDSGRVDVLLVAIHNSIIQKYTRVAELASLSVGFLEIETFSAIRALLSGGISTSLILDIGSNATNVSIVENGVVYRSHVVNRGSQDITVALSRALSITPLQAEEMKREKGILEADGEESKVAHTARLILENIFTEANRVLLEYEKKQHAAVSRVFLSGGGALLKGLLSFAKQNLDTEVIYGNPFSKVETPAFLESVLKDIGPSFSVAVGVALRRLQELE
ncbi:MAG: type IV pilus assembly protein PilM [Parcubacteria group bacterium]|nr:type IV pilus assembly protein PilM [Parcubacteria group bacterium]